MASLNAWWSTRLQESCKLVSQDMLALVGLVGKSLRELLLQIVSTKWSWVRGGEANYLPRWGVRDPILIPSTFEVHQIQFKHVVIVVLRSLLSGRRRAQ